MLDYLDDIDSGVFRGVTEEWKGFLLRNEMDKKDYSIKRFVKGIHNGSQILGWEFVDQKNRQNNNLKEFKIVKNLNKMPEFKEIVTDSHYF
jgi:hypothetical protein